MSDSNVEVMENKDFSKKLEERTKQFAVKIISLSSSLPETPEARVIRNQLSKSGTSIGANYREANRAISKAEFRYKIKICESEASETLYWLEIIDYMKLADQGKSQPVRSESAELLAIFTSIGSSLKLPRTPATIRINTSQGTSNL
jgi:four helix bundle protein